MTRRSGAPRKGRAAGGGWPIVVTALAVGLLPAQLRRAARDRLLDLHGRAQAWLGAARGLDPVADAPLDPRHVLQEAELLRLRRALLEAGAARELVQVVPSARLIPARATPLGSGVDAARRVLLHRGKIDGVAEGQPVLDGDGLALVGSVARATDGTSEVRLVTDPSFRIRATLSRPAGDIEGLLRGDGSGTLLFEPAVLDPTLPVPVPATGESVVASRDSKLCGVQALLGVVIAVERRAGSPVPVARIRPPSDLARLAQVVVVRQADGPGGS